MDDLVEFLTGGTSLLALAAELDEADDELAAAEHRNQLLRRTFASAEEKAVLDFGLRSGRDLVRRARSKRDESTSEASLSTLRSELQAARAEAAAYKVRADRAEQRLAALVAVTSASEALDASLSPKPATHGARHDVTLQTPPTAYPSASALEQSRDSPRDVIESIRAARLEARGTAGEALQALVGRALSALSRDLYSGAGHVLAEILQNCDDASFGEAEAEAEAARGAVPRLRVSLTGAALLFECNELGFRERDVRAVCDLGSSTKGGKGGQTGSIGSIGRKGLGFKSCFAVSDLPHVASGGFSFRFDARDGLYGALVPEWVAADELHATMAAHLQSLGVPSPLVSAFGGAPGGGTAIWLPLRGPAPPLAIAPTALLFLRKLCLVELVLPARAAPSTAATPAVATDDSVLASQAGGEARSEIITIRRLSMAAAAAPAEAPAAERASLLVEVSGRVRRQRDYLLWREIHEIAGVRTEIVLAFRDQDDTHRAFSSSSSSSSDPTATTSGALPSDDAPATAAAEAPLFAGEQVGADLHAFLPVGSPLGLPFCLHADWDLVASRQSLHLDSAWNAALRDLATAALLRAVRAEQRLAHNVGAWLPRPEACREPFWRPLFEVGEGVAAEPMLISESGDRLAPRDALLREALAATEHEGHGARRARVFVPPSVVSNAWLHQSTGRFQFVSAVLVRTLGIEALCRLGCRRVTVDDLLECLRAWAPGVAADDADGKASCSTTTRPCVPTTTRPCVPIGCGGEGDTAGRMSSATAASAAKAKVAASANDAASSIASAVAAPTAASSSASAATLEASPAIQPALFGCAATLEAWLAQLHRLLFVLMNSHHVAAVRTLPLLLIEDWGGASANAGPGVGGGVGRGGGGGGGFRGSAASVGGGGVAASWRLRSASGSPPVVLAPQSSSNTGGGHGGGEALLSAALRSGALDVWRVANGVSPPPPEQLAFLACLGVSALDDAMAVRSVARQHAAGRVSSIAACWQGLRLVRDHLPSFIAEEAASHEVSVAEGARAALAWLRASLLWPATDGLLRPACSLRNRTLLGVPCPGCCGDGGGGSGGSPDVHGGRGRARPQLPLRMLLPRSAELHRGRPRNRRANASTTTAAGAAVATAATAAVQAAADGSTAVAEAFAGVAARRTMPEEDGGEEEEEEEEEEEARQSLAPADRESTVEGSRGQGSSSEAPESGDGVDDDPSGTSGDGGIDDGGDGGAEASVRAEPCMQTLTTAPPLPNSSVRAEPPQLRVQETFERVARGTGHGQVMLTALSSASVHWVGARCSGGVDKGQVGWAVRWTRGELAAGFGCVAAQLDRVGLGRHALCIVVTSDGCATLRHAGGSRPLAWPPLQSGDTLGLHLDLQGTRAALLLTLNGTLRDVDGECFYDARGVDKAAIPLAPELSYHATLHPTVCLRRGPHCAEPAEATITLAAPLANALLHRRGFRPISQVLAAQRGGGRAVPMLGPPPHPPRRTHHDGGGGASQGACSAGHSSGGADGGGADGTTGAGGGGGAEGKYESDLPLEALLWEQFASLMGATPHLVSCTVHAWWRDMLPKAEPASLAAVECVICCAPLVDAEARNRKPRAGQEPVGTVCGHRYHSACIFRWLAADEHWEGPTCPCCRTVLHPTRDVRPLGIETAALALSTSLRFLLRAMSGEATDAAAAGRAAAAAAAAAEAPRARLRCQGADRGGGDEAEAEAEAAWDSAVETVADPAAEAAQAAAEAVVHLRMAAMRAAADLTSAAALATALLQQCASDTQSAMVVGSAIVDSSAGRVRLDSTVLQPCFPLLSAAASTLPIAFLRPSPLPSHHHDLLGRFGCATSAASMRSQLQALKAVCLAMSNAPAGSGCGSGSGGGSTGGGALTTTTIIGCSGGSGSSCATPSSSEAHLHRAVLYAMYTSLDNLASSSTSGGEGGSAEGEGEGGRGGVERDKGAVGSDGGEAAKVSAASASTTELRAAFAQHALLWKGPHAPRAFATSMSALCHAPRTAALLNYVDPCECFPEMSAFFLHRLRLPTGGPATCMQALTKLSDALDVSRGIAAAVPPSAASAAESAAAGSRTALDGGAVVAQAAEVLAELETIVRAANAANEFPGRGASSSAHQGASALLDNELSAGAVRVLAADTHADLPWSLRSLRVVAPTVEAPLLYLPDVPPPAGVLLVTGRQGSGAAPVTHSAPAAAPPSLPPVVRLFADVAAFDAGALARAPTVAAWLRSRRLLVPLEEAVVLGAPRAEELVEAPHLEQIARDVVAHKAAEAISAAEAAKAALAELEATASAEAAEAAEAMASIGLGASAALATALAETEVEQLLALQQSIRVRTCRRIEQPCSLHPPLRPPLRSQPQPSASGAHVRAQYLSRPPVTRCLAVRWALHGDTTIVLSMEVPSLLTALAEALETLLAKAARRAAREAAAAQRATRATVEMRDVADDDDDDHRDDAMGASGADAEDDRLMHTTIAPSPSTAPSSSSSRRVASSRLPAPALLPPPAWIPPAPLPPGLGLRSPSHRSPSHPDSGTAKQDARHDADLPSTGSPSAPLSTGAVSGAGGRTLVSPRAEALYHLIMEVARNGVGSGAGPAAAAASANGPRALKHISPEPLEQQQQQQPISESLEAFVSPPALPSGLLGDAMEKESPAVADGLRRAAADALGIEADGSAASVRHAPSAAGPLSVSTDGTSGEVRVRCTLSVVR